MHLNEYDPEAIPVIEDIERFIDGLVGRSVFDARWAWISQPVSDTNLTNVDDDEDDGVDRLTREYAMGCTVAQAVCELANSVYDWNRADIVRDRKTIHKRVMAAARATATATALMTPCDDKHWPHSDRGVYRSELTKAERERQADLLRDLIGNPFRSRPVVLPSWLLWNDGVVVKLAESIYQERAFDRMGILADALEEAGCENADIVKHCRRPNAHVRGCWVIDLLLRRE